MYFAIQNPLCKLTLCFWVSFYDLCDLVLSYFYYNACSLISTPPPERVPIKTHLSAYTKERVISAIEHELDRGGQVFYVLPRIKGNLIRNVSCIMYTHVKWT